MRKVFFSAAAVLLALPALTGCTGPRHNLTPELMTLTDRPADVENSFALMSNENWRMFVSDWQRGAYIDRPMRLTPEPIPH
jgi:hypothetical protein